MNLIIKGTLQNSISNLCMLQYAFRKHLIYLFTRFFKSKIAELDVILLFVLFMGINNELGLTRKVYPVHHCDFSLLMLLTWMALKVLSHQGVTY